jgi:hypothetical protein
VFKLGRVKTLPFFMEKQLTNKLMVVENNEEFKRWRIACGCSEQDHDVELFLEIDKNDEPYGTRLILSYPSQYQEKYIESRFGILIYRLKTVWKVLTGEHQARNEILLDEDNVEAFQEVLTVVRRHNRGEKIDEIET